MSRSTDSLNKAIEEIPKIREEFWNDIKIPSDSNRINLELEKAGRVADFLELGELMARDALERKESCGGHFREESQTDENEALRDDEKFCHVAAWEYEGEGKVPSRHKEELVFENVKLTQRSYK
jgi:succinate dehydrogenase / fumarate reductase flavoprotein subunit